MYLGFLPEKIIRSPTQSYGNISDIQNCAYCSPDRGGGGGGMGDEAVGVGGRHGGEYSIGSPDGGGGGGVGGDDGGMGDALINKYCAFLLG